MFNPIKVTLFVKHIILQYVLLGPRYVKGDVTVTSTGNSCVMAVEGD